MKYACDSWHLVKSLSRNDRTYLNQMIIERIWSNLHHIGEGMMFFTCAVHSDCHTMFKEKDISVERRACHACVQVLGSNMLVLCRIFKEITLFLPSQCD